MKTFELRDSSGNLLGTVVEESLGAVARELERRDWIAIDDRHIIRSRAVACIVEATYCAA